MADWRKVAKVAILGDGRLDTREVGILRDALFADGSINKSELEFLKEVRSEAKSYVKTFTELYIDGVKSHVLKDGVIGSDEGQWLLKTLFADGSVDDDEKRLLQELKTEAASTSPEFDALYAAAFKG